MGGLERYGTLPLGSAVCHRRFTLAGSRRGGRVAEGTRLLSEYGDQTPSRVRIPPSPSVPEGLRIPSLGGAVDCLTPAPLSPAELHGRVVLVDFWTLTCINWLRTEPYVRAWSQAY